MFFHKHYKGPKTDHFDGKYFHNIPPDKRTFWDFLRWMVNRHAIPWPDFIDIGSTAIPEERIPIGEMRVTFVNHSTVLIQWDEINILTDPIWSERCSPFKSMGPKRVHVPGIEFEDLPPIDIVLLSHNHYDHMDVETLKNLHHSFDPLVITGLGNKPFLKKIGLNNVIELDWWDMYEVFPGFSIFFVPASHFSARSLFDRNRTLWGGFVLRGDDQNIYFAGDTGYGNHFKQIKERFGKIRFAILPIGTYEPRWFMKPAHMSPLDGIQAHLELNAKTSMGIHIGTFHLSDEAIDAPYILLKEELERLKIPDDTFWILNPGEERDVPH